MDEEDGRKRGSVTDIMVAGGKSVAIIKKIKSKKRKSNHAVIYLEGSKEYVEFVKKEMTHARRKYKSTRHEETSFEMTAIIEDNPTGRYQPPLYNPETLSEKKQFHYVFRR